MLRAIMFVFQLAHDLFYGVFNSDHACDAAVFVHDDGDMLTCALHLMEQVVNWFGFGHQHRIADYRFDFARHRRMVESRRAYGVLQIGHADQIVHIVTNDRHTRESGTGAKLQHVSQCLASLNADHVGARHHDLTGQCFGKREHVAQHFGNFRVEIVGFDQTVDGRAPLFDLDFFEFLVIGKIVATALRALLSANFREWGQQHRNGDGIRMLQHDIDGLGCSRTARTHQQRNHRNDDGKNKSGKQFGP